MKIAQLLATRIGYFTSRENLPVNDHSNFHRESKVHGSQSPERDITRVEEKDSGES